MGLIVGRILEMGFGEVSDSCMMRMGKCLWVGDQGCLG